MAKRKKLTLKQAKKKADDACFPVYCGMPCFLCGSRERSCGHHIIPRSQSGYHRHSVENIIPVCWKCHARIEARLVEWHVMMERLEEEFPRRYQWYKAHRRDTLADMSPAQKRDYFLGRKAWWEAHQDSGETVDDALYRALGDKE